MDAPIRVLQVVGAMRMGGIENFVMNLYRLADRTKIQFDFLYFTKEKTDFDDEILSMGGRIFSVCARHESFRRHNKELKALFACHPEWKTVHIHNSHAMCITDAKIAAAAGRCVAVHSHNSFAAHGLLHRFFRLFLHRYTHRFFACSDLAATWMFSKSTNQKGAVELIKNGIPLKKFAPDRDARARVRLELGIAEDALVLGHVGRLTEAKNHSFLLDIFHDTLKCIPDARLLIVGGGELEADIRKKADLLGLTDRVIFTGNSTRPHEMLQAMDIFVFPSIYEGFPLTLVEAQANGLPCLVSTAVTAQSLLTPSALHIPLTSSVKPWVDAILELSRNIQKRDNFDILQKAGYDTQTTADKLFAFYLQNN